MVMYAKDIMSPVNESVSGDVSLQEGAEIMAKRGKGFLIVESGGKRGIVTEWDYVKAIARHLDLKSAKLSEVMSQPLVLVPASMPTDEVTQMMSQRGIRRVLVEDGGKIVGIITSRDVLRIFREYVDQLSHDLAQFRPF